MQESCKKQRASFIFDLPISLSLSPLFFSLSFSPLPGCQGESEFAHLHKKKAFMLNTQQGHLYMLTSLLTSLSGHVNEAMRQGGDTLIFLFIASGLMRNFASLEKKSLSLNCEETLSLFFQINAGDVTCGIFHHNTKPSLSPFHPSHHFANSNLSNPSHSDVNPSPVAVLSNVLRKSSSMIAQARQYCLQESSHYCE